jgi:AcrR family transcriptional regulator
MTEHVSSFPRREMKPRQAETVQKLLVAGAEVLRAVGHEALTMRNVASRAGVSPATAYTYLASKNHLFAELFWRALEEDPGPGPVGSNPVERVQSVTRQMATLMEGKPELAAAVTTALLGTDPDVERLRLRIGGEFLRRFSEAMGEPIDPAVLETLTLAFQGALLQAGMGLMSYTEVADRLDSVVAVIMKGHQ